MKCAAYFLGAVVVGMPTNTAFSAPVLQQVVDQLQTAPPPYTESRVHDRIVQAQTFTVGYDGTLNRLDVVAERVAAYGQNLLLEIRDTFNGVPSTNVLQSVVVGDLPPKNSETFTTFDLSVPVSSGQTLAFVFRMVGGDGEAILRGDASLSSDPYAGGGLWTFGNRSVNSGDWYPNGNHPTANFDVSFRTFVLAVVPEPSTALLVSCGLLLSPLRNRRRTSW